MFPPCNGDMVTTSFDMEDDKENRWITCAEARKHGAPGVRRSSGVLLHAEQRRVGL